MNLRANPEKKFLLKYLLIGLGCLAFAAWSVYDGLYTFPNKIPRAEAWAKLEAEVEADPNLDRTDLNTRWKEIAKENGWSPKQLGHDDTVDNVKSKIVYQYVFMALGVVIGLPCLIWYFKAKNSWIESTGDGLRSSDGKELKLHQIQKFDKKKWERKGIGVLHYETDNGELEKFVVDDLKYDRETTDKIVRWVESQIPTEMIVNGKPEPEQKEPPANNPFSDSEPETNDVESV